MNITTDSALRSIGASWYMSQNKILVGQSKEFEKNSRVFIDRDQPLIPAITIKEEEIKVHEDRIKELRMQIKEALEELDNVEYLDLSDNLNTTAASKVEEEEENEAIAVDEQETVKVEVKPEELVKVEIKAESS